MKEQDVINMRKAMQTLPSQNPEKSYNYQDDITSIEVNMTDYTINPYKVIVTACCATWGDDKTGSMGKWAKLTPENRYRVVLSHLTGNTLPQASEGINFQFEVNGITRSDFDQHARARIGSHFMSIGTRDNNKLDSRFLFYDHIVEHMKKDLQYKEKVESWIKLTKDLYEETINESDSSWQIGRAFLPQCVNHSYTFGMNLSALRGQMSRRLMFCEQEGIVALHWKIRKLVADKFPLIGEFMIPVCDKTHKCVYMEGPEGLTTLFSNLFDGCGRWKIQNTNNSEYKEFNHSCTNPNRLKELGIPVLEINEFKHYGPDDYEKLSDIDKKLFEQN